jgi:hypothetical protein
MYSLFHNPLYDIWFRFIIYSDLILFLYIYIFSTLI